LARFGADFDALLPTEQDAFLRSASQFVEDMKSGAGFRKGLRVKGVRGAPGIFEMTWANDGRATFEYGEPVIPGESHIVWRRVGTHAILSQP